jgi:Skp family chaperone for outer membrane proteins
MRFSFTALLFAAAVAVPAGLVLSQERAVRADGPPPFKVGVVDLATVFERYKKSKQLEQRINDERDRLKKELDDLRKEISEISKELELLDTSSQAYELKEEERKVSVAKFELKKERLESRIRKRWEDYNLEILDDIEAAVKKVGEEQKFTLILKVDGKPADDRLMTGQYALAAKASKTVFYASGDVDITKSVVDVLNRQFDLDPNSSGSSGTPPGAKEEKPAFPAPSAGSKPGGK